LPVRAHKNPLVSNYANKLEDFSRKEEKVKYYIYKLDTTKPKLVDDLPPNNILKAQQEIFNRMRNSKDSFPMYQGFVDQYNTFEDMEWYALMLNTKTNIQKINRMYKSFGQNFIAKINKANIDTRKNKGGGLRPSDYDDLHSKT
jgi:hypothetical protein